MKKYTGLATREFKVNKRKYFSTVLGCVLAVLLFTMIFNIRIFNDRVNQKEAKVKFGNYEGEYSNLDKGKIENLRKNVLVKDLGIVGKSVVSAFNGEKEVSINLGILDKEAVNKIFKESLEAVKGNLPTNSSEILLSEKGLRELDKKIGDEITIEGKNYKIVGSFAKDKFDSEVTAMTFSEDFSLAKSLNVFVNTINSGNKMENIKNVSMDAGIVDIKNGQGFSNGESAIKNGETNEESKLQVKLNVPLLYSLYNINTEGQVEKDYSLLMLISVALITGFLIYAAISSHMNSREKEIGVLRAIGATAAQIRTLIFKEGIIIGAFALIPGILLGYGIFYIYVWIFKNYMGVNTFGYSATFYPVVIILVTLITFIILAIVMASTAIRMGRISPIEGITESRVKTAKKLKVKKSKIFKKLFGIKGELAYRNIRANNRSFVVTIITLVVSFLVFTSFSTWFKEFNGDLNLMISKNSYDGIARTHTYYFEHGFELEDGNLFNLYNASKKANLDIEKIMKENSVKDIDKAVYLNVPMTIVDGTLNKDVDKDSAVQNGKDVNIGLGTILVYDDNVFNKIKGEINGNNPTVEAFNKGGIILVNGNKIGGDLKGKNFEFLTNKKEQLDLKIKNENIISAEGGEVDQSTTDFKFNVLGTINQNSLIDSNKLFRTAGVNFIISKTYLENNLKSFEKIMTPVEEVMYYNFNNEEGRKAGQKNIENYIEDKYQGSAVDLYDEKVQLEKQMTGTAIIIYGIIAIVILILTITIINRKNKEMLDRKKELGTMLAIGMEKRELGKSIILESVIQWGIFSVVSIPISIIVSNKILDVLQANSAIKTTAPIGVILLGDLMILIVLILSVYLPLRKFNKSSKIELLKSE